MDEDEIEYSARYFHPLGLLYGYNLLLYLEQNTTVPKQFTIETDFDIEYWDFEELHKYAYFKLTPEVIEVE